ncbi:MAG: preprotein translocase subunit YajC [Lactobacillus sp.]
MLFLASNQAAGAGNTIFVVVMLIVLILFTYFGMIRPQRKQQEQHRKMVSTLGKGDRVILIDGMHGKIDRVDNDNKTVVIDADGIYLTFSINAIRQVLPTETATQEAAKPAKTDDKKANQPGAAGKKAEESSAEDK